MMKLVYQTTHIQHKRILYWHKQYKHNEDSVDMYMMQKSTMIK